MHQTAKSPNRIWWSAATGLVVVLVFGAAAGYFGVVSENGETQDVSSRRSFYIRILKDAGELNRARRQQLLRCRTIEELEAAFQTAEEEQLAKITEFNGARAFQYLETICNFGPRRSGSVAMQRQQAWVKEHFEKLGGRVEFQSFDRNVVQQSRPLIRDPEQDGKAITCNNIIVRWNPSAKARILLCAHYDTRPYPDEEFDPQLRRGPFIGANDGASGVALLCELGNHMKELRCNYGVDFVLFDAEEFIFEDFQIEDFFLGSTYFAQQYAADKQRAFTYHGAILFDMVADRHLELFREVNSTKFAPRIVNDVWAVAKRLGVKEFRQGRPKHEVRDDHLPLNQIARIPAIDIIDFDYPSSSTPERQQYWHTQKDTPDKCSPVSLAKVGWVIKTWLEQIRKP